MTNKEDCILFQKGNPFIPGVTKAAGGYNFCASFLEPEATELHLSVPGHEKEYIIRMGEGKICGASAAVLVKGEPDRKTAYYYTCRDQKIADPYAKTIREGISYITPSFKGAADADIVRIAPEDRILYKLHVRGFTKKDTSVPEKLRGTFSGAAAKIRYLKRLGVNTVEFMPVYTFDPVLPSGRRNYWGYAENNFYFAPNASYCATDDPVTEFRNMLRAFHRAGIACILEFHIPDSAALSIVSDALRFWAFGIGADGFHLTGNPVTIDEILRDPCLSDRMLLLNSAHQAVSPKQCFMPYGHIYAMQQEFRSSARRVLIGDAGATASFTEWSRCCPAQYHAVNSIADHNGFTLLDLVSYNEKHNEENGEGNRDGAYDNESWNCGEEGPADSPAVRSLRKRQMRNAVMMVFLSQGVPLLYAGDEFGNTQNGNNNAYCIDNEHGWLDWENASAYKDLTRFVREVISFRKKHTVLHTGFAMWGCDHGNTGLPDISFHGKELFSPEDGVPAAAVLYNGRLAKKEEPCLFLAFNASGGSYRFTLPPLADGSTWKTAITSGRRSGVKINRTEDGGAEILTVPAHTFLVLEETPLCP